MKKLILYIFFAAALASCDQTPVPDPDYREMFEGQYVGTRVNSSWSLNGPTNTTEFIDTVTVIAIGDSSVIVEAREIPIDSDGYFFEQGNGSASSYFSVQFIAPDSLNTDLNGGGLGGGYHSRFNGRRQ